MKYPLRKRRLFRWVLQGQTNTEVADGWLLNGREILESWFGWSDPEQGIY
jgi:hypothetical protein